MTHWLPSKVRTHLFDCVSKVSILSVAGSVDAKVCYSGDRCLASKCSWFVRGGQQETGCWEIHLNSFECDSARFQEGHGSSALSKLSYSASEHAPSLFLFL